MEEMVAEKCISVIEALKKEGLVEDVAGRLQNTAYGNAAARYCVRLPTMSRILNTPGDAKLKDIVKFSFGGTNAIARNALQSRGVYLYSSPVGRKELLQLGH